MKYTMKLSVFLHYDSAVFAVIVCLWVRLSVCLSVCHKLVLDRNDWMNPADLRMGFFLPIPHCVIRKFGYLQKLRYFPVGLFQTPDLEEKFSPPQVHHVVNKTHHRRRWGLLATPIRQSTSRGCLLQIGQL